MQSSSEGRLQVLEFESSIESALNGVIMTMSIIGLLCLMVGLGSGSLYYPPALWVCLPTFLSALGVGWIRYRTRVQYVLDPQRQQLLLRRRIFSYEALIPVAQFDEMECVTLGGKRQLKEFSLVWDQASFLILKNGRRVRVSDYEADSSFGIDSREASGQLASKLEIPFIPWTDPKKRRLRVQRTGNKVVVSHTAPPIHPFLLVVGVIVSLSAVWMAYSLHEWGPL